MSCDSWRKRVENYRMAVQAYRDAADELNDSPGREFNRRWQHAERARRSVDRARTALLEHEREHECLTSAQFVAAGVPDIQTEDFILGDQGQPGG